MSEDILYAKAASTAAMSVSPRRTLGSSRNGQRAIKEATGRAAIAARKWR